MFDQYQSWNEEQLCEEKYFKGSIRASCCSSPAEQDNVYAGAVAQGGSGDPQAHMGPLNPPAVPFHWSPGAAPHHSHAPVLAVCLQCVLGSAGEGSKFTSCAQRSHCWALAWVPDKAETETTPTVSNDLVAALQLRVWLSTFFFLKTFCVPAASDLFGSWCHSPSSWRWKEAFHCCCKFY